jgi:hypothetical protein
MLGIGGWGLALGDRRSALGAGRWALGAGRWALGRHVSYCAFLRFEVSCDAEDRNQ